MKNVGKVGNLYFLESEAQNAIKVGFAADLQTRIPSLQSGNPAKLVVTGVVPIKSEAEVAFHEILKPHRIAREWYPNDPLLLMLHGELCETWCDKLEAIGGRDYWLENGDEWTNPGQVYLEAADVRRCIHATIKAFFDTPLDELEPDEIEQFKITNHWLPKPKPR